MFFFFSSRRRHTRLPLVSWARRCVQETDLNIPMDSNKVYDALILGGGYGGLIAGLNAARGGLKVGIIEKRKKIGGTCLWEGCIPSKNLLKSSSVYYECKKESGKYGVTCSNVELNYEKMVQKKDAQLEQTGKNILNRLASLNIDFIPGFGKLKSATEIEVDIDGQKSILKGKRIVLNMGGESTGLPGNIIPVDHDKIIQSTDALNLKVLPKKMIVVGGGYIGLELGSHFHKLGVEVTIIEFFDFIVPMMDQQVSSEIKTILEKQGMKILVGHKVTSGGKTEKGVKITVEKSKGGESQIMEADILFIATGRRPLTRNIGLEEVGVKLDNLGRVIIDRTMESNIKGVYAIGDVSNMGAPLAHKAEDEALSMVDQWLGKETHLNYDNVPTCVFTHPEIACVGKTEEQLQKEKIEYKKGICTMMGCPRAKCNDETDGFIKILADKKTNKILGVHMIGAQVAEQIIVATYCLEYGTTVNLVSRMSAGHPSFNEAFKDAAQACWKAE
eukprot:TRINITY_DN337_c0_g1_i4.p1 TRINITY_DN337_c0_g1~~TRINITY_DN337_c0_g1_i4.p1  ORF type:complete len:502 (+),score=223.46 TRINITY_DN337_c0_g1_i4:2-1507(+)